LPFKQSSLIVASARVIAGILTITLKNNNGTIDKPQT